MKVIILILLLLSSSYIFNLHDIKLQDDSFHSDLPLHVETWYFEAIFRNTYSTVFMITSLSNGSKGLLLLGFYIYKNGTLRFESRAMEPSFYLSNKIPLLIINGKEIMKGYVKNGKICYNISFSVGENSINLTFVNRTKGWKSDITMKGWWLAIPNMEIKGELRFDGNLMKVEGKGYHDHNIFSIFSPILSNGHIFGKIIEKNFSLACGELLHRFYRENFIIFSNKSYTFLHNISIKNSKFIVNHGKIIPTEFIAKGNDKGIYINIDCKTIDFHFIRLPFLRYWRYHVRATGTIKINGNEYGINDMEIVEYLLYQRHI